MKIPFNIWNRKKQKGKGEDPDAVRVLNEDNSVSVTVTIGDVEYTVNNLKPKSTPSKEEREKAKEKRMLLYKRADKRERKLIIWRVLRYMITYRDLSSSSNFYEYKNNLAGHNHAVEELKISKPDKYHLEAAIRFCQIEYLCGRCDYELTQEDIDLLENWETITIDNNRILNDIVTSYKEYWDSVLDSYTRPSARIKRLQYLIQDLQEVMKMPFLQNTPNVLNNIKELQDYYQSLLK